MHATLSSNSQDCMCILIKHYVLLCMHNLINQACLQHLINFMIHVCNTCLTTMHVCVQDLCNPNGSQTVPGPYLFSPNSSPNVPGAYLCSRSEPTKYPWDHTQPNWASKMSTIPVQATWALQKCPWAIPVQAKWLPHVPGP